MTSNRIRLDSHTMTEFVNDLETHSRNSDVFFSYALLDLLGKSFGYKHSAITIYENTEFVTGCTRQRASLLGETYKNSFHNNDALSKYLFTCPPFVRAAGRSTYRGTEITDLGDFLRTDYADFIGIGGLQYIAVMDFNRHRINIFKEYGEQDFSDADIQFLSDVKDIIEMKHNSFKQYKKLSMLNDTKNHLFSGVNAGYIVFGEQNDVMDYNKQALYYTTRMFESKNLQYICAQLLDMFYGCPELDDDLSVSKEYKGHLISMKKQTSLNSIEQISDIYMVTIIKQEHMSLQPSEIDAFSTLSGREMEILEAFCSGADSSEIAARLFISENTVRKHIKNIYRKLGVDNQRKLVWQYSQYVMTV